MYTKIHNKLLKEAKKRHGSITLCTQKGSCISIYKDYILLWYNSKDNSTHIIKYDIINNCIVKKGE
jgi:hypothetical protein